MMLERLQIQNFQAHDKLRIDFNPSITTIVGPSDAGKSAIIRALQWVCTNEPGGDAFVRHGTKGCTVKATFDGQTVTRKRSPGGSVNTYHLGDKEFKAFGRGVPEPVEAMLGLGPVCWQRQHDAPYWFSNSAGEVSRQLNAIVNLGIIDSTLTGVARVVNKSRTRLEVAEETLTTAKATTKELEWVPDYVNDVEVVETAEAAHLKSAEDACTAHELVKGALHHQEAHEQGTALALAAAAVVEAGSVARDLCIQSDMIEKGIKQAKRYEKAAGRSVGPLEDRLEAMAHYMARYVEVQRHSDTIGDLIDHADNIEMELCQLNKDMKKAEAAVPKLCPTCGR